MPEELRSVKERNKSDVLKKISVNDVTLYGGEVQGFCDITDNST